MAKKSDYIALSKAQKEEVRRLTQLANRRIAAAFKAYESEGKTIVPNEVTGGIHLREDWASKKYAISRSVKFKSQKEYREQLHWLRQFEHMRPGIKEYTQVQREKTLQGLETALGDVPEDVQKKVGKMTAPQLSEFWNVFSDKAARMGAQYSSNDAMDSTINEFFPEDKEALVQAPFKQKKKASRSKARGKRKGG